MRTIRDLIDKRGETDPDKTYMIAPEPGLELSFRQLKENSVRFAKYLLKLGLKKGDKISFMLGNGYQTTRIFLGSMYGGFVIAPLNLTFTHSLLQYVLEHSDTQVLFFTQDLKEKVNAAIEGLSRDILLFEIDNDAERIIPREDDLLPLSLPEIRQEDDALLLYTSGTIGLPKGVVLSHKNIVTEGKYTTMAHNLTSEHRALCSLPLYHINGEVVTTVAPLVSGGRVVMPHRFSTKNFWEFISGYRCTWFSVVPTIISYLCSSTDLAEKGLHLEQLRFGRSASSALPTTLHRDFETKFNVSIVETMGLTETAAPVFSNPLEPSRRKYGSPGQAVGNEAKIVDKEGNEVPLGAEGEILVQGDNVMKGYYKDRYMTPKALKADGWLHTGDLGRMDEDGFVFVTGRTKELIIKGGENLAPREIDEVLYKHLAVLEAAAVGIPDETYGEEVMACVTVKPGLQVTEEELLEYCLNHLSGFRAPKVIKLMDELPKGPSGKIQRLKLRNLI